jgi:transposase-like protein
MTAADPRKRRPKPRTTWHLDEVYLKIDGRMVYFWRAVDAEREVLDVLLQSKRSKKAALATGGAALSRGRSVCRFGVTLALSERNYGVEGGSS